MMLNTVTREEIPMLSSDNECTLTSALAAIEPGAQRLLATTIAWHPDLERIGEQYVAGPGTQELALNRYAPAFCRPPEAPRPLGERCIARESLLLRCDAAGGLTLRPPASRMVVALDGVALTAPVTVDAARLEAGLVLQLGGAVLLCVHWTDGLPRAGQQGELVGVSSAMRKVRDLIRQVAATELPVLLLGETGTGKELAARAVHAASRHRDGPLVAVNMAALNDELAAADLFGAAKGAYTGAERARGGFFAEAAGGTLFLDEIGNAPAAVQPMLLRVLDGGEYRSLGASHVEQSRARLVAATDQALDGADFNQPLLRRLEGFVIQLPALRERREDIGLLVAHTMRAWNDGAGSGLVMPVPLAGEMCRYHWPGNVRQLRNVVGRVLLALQAGAVPVFAALVPPDDPTAAAGATPRRTDLATVGHDAILAAMHASAWQIQAAAQALGVSRPSMYKLLAAHPLVREADAIPLDELRAALAAHRGDLTRCAMALRTPSEALRRQLRRHGLIP
jgi:two-component system nitrogen regulation response regulator GlnG